MTIGRQTFPDSDDDVFAFSDDEWDLDNPFGDYDGDAYPPAAGNHLGSLSGGFVPILLVLISFVALIGAAAFTVRDVQAEQAVSGSGFVSALGAYIFAAAADTGNRRSKEMREIPGRMGFAVFLRWIAPLVALAVAILAAHGAAL